MQVHNSREMFRQLFRRVITEQLSWTSGRTMTPKCRFSGSSFGKSNGSPGSKGYTEPSTSMGSSGLWRKSRLTTRGQDLVMVRSVESLGGLRQMGIIERPAARAAQHGSRNTLPITDEERRTDEFLKEEKKKEAAKVIETEQVVGGVAGQSLTATDAEFVQRSGSNTADTQEEIAQEMIANSESGQGNIVDPESGSRHHVGPNGEHSEIDEEVRRGLVADSALPMGRTEKTDDKDNEKSAFKEDEHIAETKVDVSEHGSFKAL